jgi:hypothetical protein
MIDNLIRKKQQVKQFLLDYDKAQGVTATLSQNLMIMDILLRHYEQKKVSSQLSPN